MASRKVLVTGGAGFIGSHIARAYLDRGDQVWIVDDLSTGKLENVPDGAQFVKASIRDANIRDLFASVGGFDLVSLHAAQIDVRKSVADPRLDAAINIDGVLNLLELCRTHGAGRVVFVSSGGVVYGEPEQRPTPEEHEKLPISPYGISKLTAEYYLYYYHRVHGLDYVALRYSNVYGPRQDPHGEAGVVAIFSNRILGGEQLTVFGDGKQTRDYVFVGDVARANLLVGDAVLAPGTSLDDRAYNVGTGVETSVITLARTLQSIGGQDLPLIHAPERRGELRYSCLSADKLRKLGWAPHHDIAHGLRETFEFIKAKEFGR